LSSSDAILEDAGVVKPDDRGERAGGVTLLDRRFSHVTNKGHSSDGDMLSFGIRSSLHLPLLLSSSLLFVLFSKRLLLNASATLAVLFSIFSNNTSKQ
jgi:hypothetical protein